MVGCSILNGCRKLAPPRAIRLHIRSFSRRTRASGFHRSPLPCVHCDGHMLADTPRASPWCPWALLCRAPSGQRPDKPCSHLATWECALGQGGEPVWMFCMFALMAKAGDFCPKCSQTNTLQMPPADTTSFRKCLNDCQMFHSPQYLKKKKDCYSAPASTPHFISEFPICQTGSSGKQGPSCG